MTTRSIGEPAPDFGSTGLTDGGTVYVYGEPSLNLGFTGLNPGPDIGNLSEPSLQYSTANISDAGYVRISEAQPKEYTYYRMRALDLGGPTPLPVFWTTLDPTSMVGAPDPPNGGPYVEPTILFQWMQRQPAKI